MGGDIKAKVIEAITKNLQPDDPKKVTLESRLFEDLEADSLGMVELVMALEQEFDIDIADDAVKQIKTVQDVCSYIEDQLSKKDLSKND